MTQRQISAANGAPSRDSQEAHDHHTYFYPPVPTPQQPLPARINYARRFSEGKAAEGTRVQSSLSTISASSGPMFDKQSTPSPGSQWPSPTRKHSLMNGDEQHARNWQSSNPEMSHSRQNNRRKPEMAARVSPASAYAQGRQGIEKEDDHALWILFWLSVLDPLHSFASCLFTLFVTFGLLLALPIRLCHKRSSLGDQVIRTVAPMFKNHLDMMYASSVEYAFEWNFRPGMLIFMHLVSPLISVGVAVAAWVTAAFWIFTSIMGNPDGTERRDDGADAVLAVRNWWESCLLTVTRPQAGQSMRSVV